MLKEKIKDEGWGEAEGKKRGEAGQKNTKSSETDIWKNVNAQSHRVHIRSLCM